jgi:cell division transport system permease protein
VLSFLIREAARDLRRGGRVGIAAVLLIGISLTVLGGFWLLSVNLGRTLTRWGDRVRVIVYLESEPAPAEVEDLLRKIEAAGGVQHVRYISRAEALDSLRRALDTQGDVLEQLPRNPLPAAVEVTLDSATATPEGTRALADRLLALAEVDDVQGGGDWVESLARWRRLLGAVGIAAGGLLALAAILTVTTATTLVLHARQQEVEIMRLVGASEMAIRLPLLLQGMALGLAGAALALAALQLGHALATPHLEPLLGFTLGLDRVAFLSLAEMLALVLGGAALGGLGGLLAKGRVAT